MKPVEREIRNFAYMVAVFCRSRHSSEVPCESCAALLAAVSIKLRMCPFGEGKSACGRCRRNCFGGDLHSRTQQVMRVAGPRMLLRHPLQTLEHLAQMIRNLHAPARDRLSNRSQQRNPHYREGMEMDLIQVDKEKCNQCGFCVDVCSVDALEMGSYGPQVTQRSCISCGHCVAVCPTEALDHVNAPLAAQIPLEGTSLLDAGRAALFLRSRRSVRNFQQHAVPREKILQLLDVARFAPSDGNTQGVSYHVIDNPETLHSITAAFMDWAEEAAKQPSPWSGLLSARANAYRRSGRDGILWSAPCLIVAVMPTDFLIRGRSNTFFSFGYAQLYAPTIGLGTCWASGLEFCINAGYQPVIDLLNLPEKTSMAGALVAGYPRYEFKRLVDRASLQITWADS